MVLGFGFRQQTQEEYWVNAVLLAVLPASSTLTIREKCGQPGFRTGGVRDKVSVKVMCALCCSLNGAALPQNIGPPGTCDCDLIWSLQMQLS